MDPQTLTKLKSNVGGNPQLKAALVEYFKSRRADTLEQLSAAPDEKAMLRIQGKALELRDVANDLEKW